MSRIYLGLVVLLVALSGCKNDSEAAMSSMIDKTKEVVKILKDIKDKDSAVAAKPKLEALNKEMNEITSKISSKKFNEEEMKKAEEKYKAEGKEAFEAMFAEMTRIAQIDGAGQALGGGPMGMPRGGPGMFK